MLKALLSALLLFIFISCSVTKNIPRHDDALLSKIMNVYIDSVTIKKYGVTALVRHNGKTVTYSIGQAGNDLPMTDNKVFNIASLTKTFTAVLVMQEVEKGTLKLSDSISKWFPENPNVSIGITVEQLLRHRSGLGELIVDSLVNEAFTDPKFSYNHDYLYNKIPKPLAQPDIAYNYCNTNYILLGYILEAINDRPYADLLQERIFTPCGMEDSYAYYSKSIKNTAHPVYDGEDLYAYVNFYFFKNYCFSAGGVASNLQDLALFFNNLYTTETLIKRASFNQMIDFKKDHYGLGIEKLIMNTSKKGTQVLYGHGGDNLTVKLRNYYNPATKDLLIIASNQYNDPYMLKMVNKILVGYDF